LKKRIEALLTIGMLMALASVCMGTDTPASTTDIKTDQVRVLAGITNVSADAAKAYLEKQDIYPDSYVDKKGTSHWFTLTGGQIQWINHQAGISPSSDMSMYYNDTMYIYPRYDIQKIQNAVSMSGDPVLFSVMSGPLTKTTFQSVYIDGVLYNLYAWHEVVSIGYPWVELIRFVPQQNGIITDYQIIGGPYDATTIPSYFPVPS
jgi:hypothetical protein